MQRNIILLSAIIYLLLPMVIFLWQAGHINGSSSWLNIPVQFGEPVLIINLKKSVSNPRTVYFNSFTRHQPGSEQIYLSLPDDDTINRRKAIGWTKADLSQLDSLILDTFIWVNAGHCNAKTAHMTPLTSFDKSIVGEKELHLACEVL